jgi:hypothetical protein
MNKIKRLAEINEEDVNRLFKFFVKNSDSPAVTNLCAEWLDDSFLWDDYFESVHGVEEEYDEQEEDMKKIVNADYYDEMSAIDFFLNGKISYGLDNSFEEETIDAIFDAFPEDVKELYNNLSNEEKQELINKIDSEVFSKEPGKNGHGFSFIVNHCLSDDFDRIFGEQFDKFINNIE